MKKETSRMVKFTLDPANPPTMTPEQMARWEAMTDDDIDYSDIPDQTGFDAATHHGTAERKATASRKDATAKKKASVA